MVWPQGLCSHTAQEARCAYIYIDMCIYIYVHTHVLPIFQKLFEMKGRRYKRFYTKFLNRFTRKIDNQRLMILQRLDLLEEICIYACVWYASVTL